MHARQLAVADNLRPVFSGRNGGGSDGSSDGSDGRDGCSDGSDSSDGGRLVGVCNSITHAPNAHKHANISHSSVVARQAAINATHTHTHTQRDNAITEQQR